MHTSKGQKHTNFFMVLIQKRLKSAIYVLKVGQISNLYGAYTKMAKIFHIDCFFPNRWFQCFLPDAQNMHFYSVSPIIMP